MALRTVIISEHEAYPVYYMDERPNAEWGNKVTPEFIARYKMVNAMWHDVQRTLADLYYKEPEPTEYVPLTVPAFEALGELIEEELSLK